MAANQDYFNEYTNLQKVKHDLIRHYLGGWFAKLGLWAGRIIYFDTHAGRGGYADGHLGSPLVALDTFAEPHGAECTAEEVRLRFLFIERDAANFEQLKKEIAQRKLPPGVHVDPHCDDAFSGPRKWWIGAKALAPAFIFVDPYGFVVPAATLRAVLKAGRVEVFVNLIWRELDMAIAQCKKGKLPGMVDTLNKIFDGEDWRTEIDSVDIDERADQAARLFDAQSGRQVAHLYQNAR